MRIVQFLVPVSLLVAACGDRTSSADQKTPVEARERFVDAPAPPFGAQGGTAAAAVSAAVQKQPATSFWEAQKLIRTAELRIQVRDVPAALRLTDSIAQSEQTLLADSRTNQDDDGKRTAAVVLRVPSQRFTELLKSLRGLGTLQSESINAQDVTKEYADLETRLAVKEETVTRLRGLLENRTAKLSDVLDVERELARAVTELEQMKGERRYYDQQIALSTVTLTLFERVPSQITQVTTPITDALQAAAQVFGRSIGTIIYLVVALVPWAAAVLVVVWLIKPLRRRILRRRPSSAPPAG